MKLVTMLLIAELCVLILCVYDMKDTVLGNTGLNVKPMLEFDFDLLKYKIDCVDEGLRYRNSKEVVDAIKQYVEDDIDNMKLDYKRDVTYSLYKAKFLTYTGDDYKKYPEEYHRMSNRKLKYYISKLRRKYIKKDADSKKVSKKVDKVVDDDPDTKKKLIKHFAKHAQNYLVKEGILYEPMSIAEIEKELEYMKNGGMQELLSDMHNKAVSSASEVNGVSEAKRRLNVLFLKLRRLDNERPKDIKQTTYTHMLLFDILVIVCSVVATLALCITIAYHITKKQLNIAYTATGLIQVINI